MNLRNQKKFGEGQPTDRGGRPMKQPFIEIVEEWLQDNGKVEFEPKDVELLPNGNYQIQMSNQQMIANKFLEMIMKGDARFMEMYMKLFGEYKAEKREITVNQFPLQGINFDNLTDEQLKVLEEIGRFGE
jgi:hypothetical protein